MRRQRSILFLIATVDLAIICLVLLPQWSKAREVKNQIGLAEQQLNDAANRSTASGSSQASVNLVELSNDLEGQFIDQTKGVDFLDHLDTLANTDQVNIDLKFEKEPIPSTPQVIPLTVTVEGTLPAVLRFLNDLEHLPNAVTIQSLTLLSTDAEKVQANANVSTVWR